MKNFLLVFPRVFHYTFFYKRVRMNNKFKIKCKMFWYINSKTFFYYKCILKFIYDILNSPYDAGVFLLYIIIDRKLNVSFFHIIFMFEFSSTRKMFLSVETLRIYKIKYCMKYSKKKVH